MGLMHYQKSYKWVRRNELRLSKFMATIEETNSGIWERIVEDEEWRWASWQRKARRIINKN